MPRPMAKMIYLAILCIEKSLPMGGELRIIAAEDAARLTVDGRRTAAPGDLWAHLTAGRVVPELRSDGVQFALLRQCLEEIGGTLDVRFTESGAALNLRCESLQPA